ncbi:MAG: radical SAM protein [Lentisphaerae bacterium]|nr:radical SAM protein [Lentisphaerota bacterium]
MHSRPARDRNVSARRRILFLQLPLLDNDPAGAAENSRLAAAYLRHAMERGGEDRHYEAVIAGAETDRFDDRRLLAWIVARRPDVVAATLYVWNVERTVRVLRAARCRLPGLVVLAGGPEAARPHPFLFRARLADAVVCGEGEPVFAAILRRLRGGRGAGYANVAWRAARGYRWGRRPPPRPALERMLPPADFALGRPDANGVACMETARGCTAHCAFCRYPGHRPGISALPVSDVVARVRALRRRGAREIRFIDPTFNARPAFHELLRALARLNADGRLSFCAELRADTVTAETAALLAAAGVRAIEIGVQSSDPAVLRAVRRPGRPDRVMPGIARLSRQRLELTLDVMCGLPGQTAADVRATVRRLARVRGGSVQLLDTLLIPGCALRQRRARLGLRAQRRPPYRVVATPAMSAAEMLEAHASAAPFLGGRPDSPARRFVGRRLPDLFRERVIVDLDAPARVPRIGGTENRRALLFRHDRLFAKRAAVCAAVRAAVRAEPDMLWQFVLRPAWEEPLDLLDAMIATIDGFPEHYADRLLVRPPGSRRVSRRVFVLLRRGRGYDPSWTAEAEALLGRAFY